MSTTPRMNVGIPRNETTRQGLFYLAVGLTVMLLGMLGLGIALALGHHGLQTFHSVIGYAAVLVGVLAAVAAWRFSTFLGRRGIFFHAVSLPILMVLQIGLAEMGQKHVHMALGALILLGAIGLVMMSRKRMKASI